MKQLIFTLIGILMLLSIGLIFFQNNITGHVVSDLETLEIENAALEKFVETVSADLNESGELTEENKLILTQAKVQYSDVNEEFAEVYISVPGRSDLHKVIIYFEK